MRDLRYRAVNGLCILILLPALPLAFVSTVARLIADGAEWCANMVARPFALLADRVNTYA